MPVKPEMRPGRIALLVSTSALALSVVVAPVRLDQDILVPVVKVAAAERGDTRDGVSQLELLAKLGLDPSAVYEAPTLSMLTQVAHASGGGGAGRGAGGGGEGAGGREGASETGLAESPFVEPELSKFVVYFDFDKADLGPEAQAVMSQARVVAAILEGTVNVAGYADRAGPQGYNQVLSELRIDAVIKSLAAAGVLATMIQTRAYGERLPAVWTPDEIREASNRRVEIVVEPR